MARYLALGHELLGPSTADHARYNGSSQRWWSTLASSLTRQALKWKIPKGQATEPQSRQKCTVCTPSPRWHVEEDPKGQVVQPSQTP